MTPTATAPTGLELLTSPAAGDLVAAVLAPAGGRPVSFRVDHVDHQPDRRTTVGYAVRVAWRDGSVTDETLGAATGRLPDGVARLTDGTTEVGMWRFPFDPALPGLAVATDPQRMGRLANRLGLSTPATPTVRAYRPGRRAVVEVATPTGRVFVKVLRPGQAERLHELHRVAAVAGAPTPAPLGWTDDGLLILSALPGHTLRHQLLAGGPAELDVDGLVAILDGLPTLGERRQTWGQKAPYYAEVIAETVPALAARARAIAAHVDHTAPEGPPQPIHGDLYEAQLMVEGGRVTGLLDIDTAGLGERLDDAGTLLAHLAVLSEMDPDASPRIRQLERALHQRFAGDLDPMALGRRTAAVVLSLATGPLRVREPEWENTTAQRIRLAERWLATNPQWREGK